MHRKIKYNMEYHHGKINNTDITEWLSLGMVQVGGAILRGCFTEASCNFSSEKGLCGGQAAGFSSSFTTCKLQGKLLNLFKFQLPDL